MIIGLILNLYKMYKMHGHEHLNQSIHYFSAVNAFFYGTPYIYLYFLVDTLKTFSKYNTYHMLLSWLLR